MNVPGRYIVAFVFLITRCDMSFCQALSRTNACVSGIQERTNEVKKKILGYTWDDIKSLRDENAKLKQSTLVQTQSIELLQQSLQDMQHALNESNNVLKRGKLLLFIWTLVINWPEWRLIPNIENIQTSLPPGSHNLFIIY